MADAPRLKRRTIEISILIFLELFNVHHFAFSGSPWESMSILGNYSVNERGKWADWTPIDESSQ
jgi:hypothetical protein